MLNDFYGKISAGLLTALLSTGCAGNHAKAERDELASMRNQLSEMRGLFATLTTRIEAVEGKLNTLSVAIAPLDRVSSTNANASPVEPHPSEGAGVSPVDVPSANDPDGAFVNDDAIQDFRKAMIRFRAGQYAEAANGFSAFLEKYPDHALAGNAAYLVARSYFKQANFKQAAEEYGRVLTTYDRSSHIAATLRDLADVEDQLKQVDQAARHRQLLASLFPHSPESENTRDDVPPAAVSPTSPPKLDSPPPTAPVPTAALPAAGADAGMPAGGNRPAAAERAVVPMEDAAPQKTPPAALDGVPASSPKE